MDDHKSKDVSITDSNFPSSIEPRDATGTATGDIDFSVEATSDTSSTTCTTSASSTAGTGGSESTTCGPLDSKQQQLIAHASSTVAASMNSDQGGLLHYQSLTEDRTSTRPTTAAGALHQQMYSSTVRGRLPPATTTYSETTPTIPSHVGGFNPYFYQCNSSTSLTQHSRYPYRTPRQSQSPSTRHTSPREPPPDYDDEPYRSYTSSPSIGDPYAHGSSVKPQRYTGTSFGAGMSHGAYAHSSSMHASSGHGRHTIPRNGTAWQSLLSSLQSWLNARKAARHASSIGAGDGDGVFGSYNMPLSQKGSSNMHTGGRHGSTQHRGLRSAVFMNYAGASLLGMSLRSWLGLASLVLTVLSISIYFSGDAFAMSALVVGPPTITYATAVGGTAVGGTAVGGTAVGGTAVGGTAVGGTA
eukprot:Lankesteria_metandrocarpae@DN438_c0_g1_i1.p1